MPIEVLELASPETFSAAGYLLANPDVQKAGMDPREHLLRHGRQEGRRQVNRQIIESSSAYRRVKYERFFPLLSERVRTCEPRFPMIVGDGLQDLHAYSAESANVAFGPFDDEIRTNPDKNYLDLGCGLRRKVYENCLYLEVYASLSADIIVPPDNTYPIKDGVLDGIGCLAVLEHTTEPWKVIDEMRRMLKPGGRVFIDWPFLQPVHGYPSHYFNATREGLLSRFRNWCAEIDVSTYPNQTPDHTIHWILGKMVGDLPEATRAKVMGMTVAELIGAPPAGEFWRSILSNVSDAWIEEFACGNSLIARKR